MASFDRVGLAELATGLVLFGALVTAVAAVLPWVSVEINVVSDTLLGIDSEGPVTIALAATAVVIAILHDWTAVTAAGIVVIGILVTVVGVAYIVDPLAAVDLDRIDGGLSADHVSAEIGLYLTALGGLGLIVGGLLGYRCRSAAPAETAPEPSAPEE